MLCDYRDIIDAAGTPLWYDEGGVPRYAVFHPQHCAPSDMVALLEIRCQDCGEPFIVSRSAVESDVRRNGDSLPGVEDGGLFVFGDPPVHYVGNLQCAGSTMTSDNVRIVQFWTHSDALGWMRQAQFEFVYDLSRCDDVLSAKAVGHS